jgi:hypothetical protein
MICIVLTAFVSIPKSSSADNGAGGRAIVANGQGLDEKVFYEHKAGSWAQVAEEVPVGGLERDG